MATNPHHFKLAITGAALTVPTLLVAFGKACEGEFAYVAQPGTGRAALVHSANKQTHAWFAEGNDGPQMPSVALDYKAGVAAIQKLRGVASEAGAIVLRDQWRGLMVCEGVPKVVLVRKLTAYGMLVLESDPATGMWLWHYEGKLTWFQPGAERSPDAGPYATLAEAIREGVAGATAGPVASACAVRDTHRRGALDASYAQEHPIQPPKPPKRDPQAAWLRKHAGADEMPLGAPEGVLAGEMPTAPVGDEPMMDAAAAVAFEAQELGEQAVDWLSRKDDAPDLEAVASSIEDTYPDTANALRGGFEWYPQDMRLRAEVWGDGSTPASWSEFMGGVFKAAHAEHADIAEGKPFEGSAVAVVLGRLDGHYRGAPYLLQRARNLIRHASALAGSPRCAGEEAQDARLAIQGAIRAYEGQRTRYLAGDGVDATVIKRAAEDSALAAAKALRSCSAGQLTLAGAMRRAPAPPPVIGQPAPEERYPDEGYGRRPAAPKAPKAPAPRPPAPAPVQAPPAAPGAAMPVNTEMDAMLAKLVLDAVTAAVASQGAK